MKKIVAILLTFFVIFIDSIVFSQTLDNQEKHWSYTNLYLTLLSKYRCVLSYGDSGFKESSLGKGRETIERSKLLNEEERLLSFDILNNKRIQKALHSLDYPNEMPSIFAGHYLVMGEGCGSNCQYFYLIDLKNGKKYNGLASSNGYELYDTSYIALLEPPDEDGNYLDPDICGSCSAPEVYLWDEKVKKFKKLDLELIDKEKNGHQIPTAH